MQAKVIIILETPNNLDQLANVRLMISKNGITYAHSEEVEVHEFHVGMNPHAINPQKVTKSQANAPGDEAEEKDTMRVTQ